MIKLYVALTNRTAVNKNVLILNVYLKSLIQIIILTESSIRVLNNQKHFKIVHNTCSLKKKAFNSKNKHI